MPIKFRPIDTGGRDYSPIKTREIKTRPIEPKLEDIEGEDYFLPPRHQDPAGIISRTGEVADYEPLSAPAYAGARALSAIIEKPAWALTEGLFRVGRFNMKIMGFDRDVKTIESAKKSPRWVQAIEDLPNRALGWLDRQIDYLSQPEKHGLITPRAESTREKIREAAYQRSIALGIGADIAESAVDLGALLVQMALIKKASPVKAGQIMPTANQLSNTLKHLGRIGLHGVATTTGTGVERAKSGLYRIAYNMTPYITNALGVTEWTAVATDTMLNTFLTSPVYYDSIKRAGGINEESLSVIAPQLVMDIAMAWNTRGLPENRMRAAWAKRENLIAKDYKVPADVAKTMMRTAHGDIDRLIGEGHIRTEPTRAEPAKAGAVRDDVIRPEAIRSDEVRPEVRPEVERSEVYKGMKIERIGDGTAEVYERVGDDSSAFLVRPDESGRDTVEQARNYIDDIRAYEAKTGGYATWGEEDREFRAEVVREEEGIKEPPAEKEEVEIRSRPAVSDEERKLIVPTKKEINEMARGLRDADIAKYDPDADLLNMIDKVVGKVNFAKGTYDIQEEVRDISAYIKRRVGSAKGVDFDVAADMLKMDSNEFLGKLLTYQRPDTKTLGEYREMAEHQFLNDERAQAYLREMREAETAEKRQEAKEKLENRRDTILGRAISEIEKSDLDKEVKERLTTRISEISRVQPGALTRAKIQAYQTEVENMIKGLKLSDHDKFKFVSRIKRANTQKQVISVMKDIRDTAEVYGQQAEKRDIRKKINREIKFTRPIKQGARRVGKYDYSTNKLVEELRGFNRYTQARAQAELDAMPTEGLSQSDLIKARMLSYKANGMKGSVELHRQILKDIQHIKETGAEAKGEADFIMKLQRAERVRELTDLLDKNKTTPKNFRTKVGNMYRLGFSNTYSMLNSMFGREIARKYDPEIKQANKYTDVFYKTEKTVEAVSEILGLEKPHELNFEFARMADDKLTLIDRDGLQTEVSKLELMDIHNSIKNELIRERYYNGFGEEQIKLALQNLTPAEMRAADFLMESLKEYESVLNERAIEITGRDNGRVKNYWPSTAEFIGDLFDDVRQQGETPSAMKGRVKNSKIMPRPVNAWGKFLKHVSEGEHVKHLSREYETLARLFKERAVAKRIKQNYGDKIYNTIMKQIDNISLNKNRESVDAVSELFGVAINNWTKAKTAANPTVFARQLMSVFNYAGDMPSGEWAKGFFNSMKNPKRTFNYMWRNCPYLKARFKMGYSEALARAIEGSSLLKTRGENFSNALTVFGRAGDIAAIIYGGDSYVRYLMKPVSEGGKGMTKAEAFKEFEWATLKGQQSPFSAGGSEFQNSRNPIARLFLSFQNANNQAFRKIVDDTISYYNKEINADQWIKTFTIHGILRSLSYVWAGQLTWEGFKGVGRLVRGEEREGDSLIKDATDEFYINLAVLPVIAVPVLEDLVDYAARLALGKPAYDPINMPMLDDITMAVQKASKKEITLEDYFDMFSVPAEMITGLPLKTIKRYYKHTAVGDNKKTQKTKSRGKATRKSKVRDTKRKR